MKIDTTKFNAMFGNASANTVISSTVFKNFIGDVKDVVDHNSPDGSYAADTGTTNVYAVTLDPTPTTYFVGMVVRFKANATNTGVSTLNVNGLGAKSIRKNGSTNLATGDILASQIIQVIYDGTNFQIPTPATSAYLALTGGTMSGAIIFAGGGSIYDKTTVYDATRINLNGSILELMDEPGTSTIARIETNKISLFAGSAIITGNGSPEGSVTAIVGSLYLRLDGGASTTLYVKTTGTGNTGWTAK